VSFGRLDLLAEGRERAAEAARAAGFVPVRRLAGGRAAAIGPGTACVGWASPSAPMEGAQARYETLAALLIDALGRLGIEARMGELPGEWCPGAWSVLVGQAKVGGLAQRMIRGRAWAEAVVVVAGADALRSVLDRVQGALGVAWRRETLAALEDVLPGIEPGPVREAFADALQARWEPMPAPAPPELWSAARALRDQHAL
jgi:lipoate-protein ligase A